MPSPLRRRPVPRSARPWCSRGRHGRTAAQLVLAVAAVAAVAVSAPGSSGALAGAAPAGAVPTIAPAPAPAPATPPGTPGTAGASTSACGVPAAGHVGCFAQIEPVTAALAAPAPARGAVGQSSNQPSNQPPGQKGVTPATIWVRGGLTPAVIRGAYGMPDSPTAGAGETIAIVDAYGDSTLAADLATFDTQFGVPACGAGCLSQVSETGTSTLPADDTSWSVETSLDVETVHAMAPGAAILLVEAASSWDNDIFAAESYAIAHAGYVSSSWGTPEQLGLAANDSAMSAPGVSTFFASGDLGGTIEYPAVAPGVISVGGTTLHTDATGGFVSESAWANGGGGCSVVERAGPAQAALADYAPTGCAGMRAVPDLAADADPASGLAIVDSQTAHDNGGWLTVGGTSLATPLVAAQAADAHAALTPTTMYGTGLILRDVTAGSNGHGATPGFDLATGRGARLSRVATATALRAAGATPSLYGHPITVTATVTTTVAAGVPSGGAGTVPDGTVAFSAVPAGLLCTAPVIAGQATCTVPPFVLASGAQTLTATYAGSPTASPSTGRLAWTVAATPPGDGKGYWMVARDGGVFASGDAAFYGSMGGQHLNAPIVGLANTPDGQGYWLVASDGGIFAFGNAAFVGSMGGHYLNQPIVGIAATPDGQGYWLVAADGGIFAFGDAAFFGSAGALALNAPIVGLAAAPSGRGYWLVASDGGLFAFGDAAFYGSMGGSSLPAPITGMARTPSGQGYLFVSALGGVYAFGDARFCGGPAPEILRGRAVAITETHDGRGYWVTGTSGVALPFGNAGYLGSAASTTVVGMAA